MNVLLSHIDWGPLVYGLIMFIGLAIWVVKFKMGSYFSLAIDIAVFILVFKLHGGTMAGGFSAMIAAMLAGLFFPMLLRK